MHRLFASKFLIDTLNAMGFSFSYTEVNAAIAVDSLHKIVLPDGYFGQFIGDNVDKNVRTLDSHNTFH